MSTFKVESASSGAAYAWPDEYLDAIELADDADEPSTEAYAHFEGRGLGTLSAPFTHKPVITAFVRAFAAEATELDAAAWALFQAADVDTAVGAQLLPLGRIVSAPVQAQFEDALNRALIDLWAQLSQADHYWASQDSLWRNLFSESRLHAEPGDYTVWISLNDAIPSLEECLTSERWPDILQSIAVPHVWCAGIIHGTIDYSLGPGLYGDEGLWNEEVSFDRLEL